MGGHKKLIVLEISRNFTDISHSQTLLQLLYLKRVKLSTFFIKEIGQKNFKNSINFDVKEGIKNTSIVSSFIQTGFL